MGQSNSLQKNICSCNKKPSKCTSERHNCICGKHTNECKMVIGHLCICESMCIDTKKDLSSIKCKSLIHACKCRQIYNKKISNVNCMAFTHNCICYDVSPKLCKATKEHYCICRQINPDVCLNYFHECSCNIYGNKKCKHRSIDNVGHQCVCQSFGQEQCSSNNHYVRTA